jgi:L-fuconolactonase
MSERADAHIHLFEKGFAGSFAGRPGVRLDEPACYASLASDYGVSQALVIGYEGAPWCVGNNDWLAQRVREYKWIRPLAYVDPRHPPSLLELERRQAQGFVGISLYVFDAEVQEALTRLPEAFWSWLVERRWLVSVNSQAPYWATWRPILQRHGELRLLVSHLGLPPKVSRAPSKPQADEALREVLALASFPGPRVKLSGFYALTEPGYDYPHVAAWPYVEALLTTFGVERLLWASDFSPCLDLLTFPQTFGLFAHMPFLDETKRRAIEGENLLGLLESL